MSRFLLDEMSDAVHVRVPVTTWLHSITNWRCSPKPSPWATTATAPGIGHLRYVLPPPDEMSPHAAATHSASFKRPSRKQIFKCVSCPIQAAPSHSSRTIFHRSSTHSLARLPILHNTPSDDPISVSSDRPTSELSTTSFCSALMKS